MKPGGGSRKGGAFERSVCKRLSLWLSRHLRDDLLWRTPGSGSRYTTAETRRKSVRARNSARSSSPVAHAGDIQATHEDAAWFVETFYFECKSYKEIEWQKTLLRRNSANLLRWWSKAKIEAKSLNRLPVLVIKGNHLPEHVGVTEEGLSVLRKGSKKDRLYVRVAFPTMDLYFVTLNDVLFLDTALLFAEFEKRRDAGVKTSFRLRRPRT